MTINLFSFSLIWTPDTFQVEKTHVSKLSEKKGSNFLTVSTQRFSVLWIWLLSTFLKHELLEVMGNYSTWQEAIFLFIYLFAYITALTKNNATYNETLTLQQLHYSTYNKALRLITLEVYNWQEAMICKYLFKSNRYRSITVISTRKLLLSCFWPTSFPELFLPNFKGEALGTRLFSDHGSSVMHTLVYSFSIFFFFLFYSRLREDLRSHLGKKKQR